MSINKNFVVKHGLEVDKDLILADADFNRVGIAVSVPEYTLHVNGGIGATSLYVSGISTVNRLELSGPVSAGGTTGRRRAYLTSTGVGVTWSTLTKNSVFSQASAGQTIFYLNYQLNSVEVYVNGVRLAPNEFEAIDGNTVVLLNPCFGGEIVEILANDVIPLSEIGIGISVSYDDNLVNGPAETTLINFTGTGVTVTSANANSVNVIINKTSNPPGKTIYVAKNGNNSNDGLTLEFPKQTLEAATEIALAGDTIKVSPGTYIENNPIILPQDVSVEGAELRNCIITPQNPGSDLFWVSNGNHITDLSFQGQTAVEGAAVIAFKPLDPAGISSDRFFDAARMIRYNLDFIAAETVGYLTSTDYRSPAFTLTSGDYTSCKDDIKDIFRAVCHDITRGGNSKCVGAGLSYFDEGLLQHIVGVKTETIDALKYAAGISRSIINNSTWGGKTVGVGTTVVSATYDNVSGITTITATNHGLGAFEPVKIVGLGFTCPSGPGIVTYPSGNLGYVFPVKRVIDVDTFEVVVGQSTLPHTYDSGGTVQKCENYQDHFTQIKDLSIQTDPTTGFNGTVNGCSNVVSAIYSCVGVVTTIIDQGPGAVGTLFNLTYPGNAGIGTTDPGQIPSQGVGLVTKGPYIRNCTNFIPSSIGMKVDGFHADPGDKDDMGITGMMSVDSYTQYNQGGVGVEVSNGAYTQLVSIFTICTDKAIVTKSSGQCDITNSNSSFGTYGLVSDGLSLPNTKSNYRYTGHIGANSTEGDFDVVISGIGNERPYSGQALYFNELYYEVDTITIRDGGSGYTEAPSIIFQTTLDLVDGDPSGPSGIRAEASAVISDGKVTGITIIGRGRNYRLSDNTTVTITGPTEPGSNAILDLTMRPIYYQVRSATLPSAGISTVTLANSLNNDVGIGSTAYLFRQSLQIVSSHSFEYIGAGNSIEYARPSRGGVTLQENEVVKIAGGEVVYTSTDQDGNFAIGDDLVIDQATGTIRGRSFERSLLNTVTPFIIALGAK
jgi:hypothetical protein